MDAPHIYLFHLPPPFLPGDFFPDIEFREPAGRKGWSSISKGGKCLYNESSIRWRRESHGTVVLSEWTDCIRRSSKKKGKRTRALHSAGHRGRPNGVQSMSSIWPSLRKTSTNVLSLLSKAAVQFSNTVSFLLSVVQSLLVRYGFACKKHERAQLAEQSPSPRKRRKVLCEDVQGGNVAERNGLRHPPTRDYSS
ncbi:hypothetical protein PLICRDRAFT_169688 [Plicaturopsis crispa FD-325 SS-3]|nr:hypothetical protein PLICRDRAFT_169688 [Plicaturopsis crispa FD-325 SS-3]